MRSFFYALAIVSSGFAFIIFMYPIVTGLPRIKDGFTALFTFGVVSSIAPVAMAFAIIPTCLAIAYDLATRDHD